MTTRRISVWSPLGGLAARTSTGRFLPAAAAPRSGREAERRDVAVLHLVVATLDPRQRLLARRRVAPGAHEVLPRRNLGGDEAALDVGVDLARCAAGGRAARDRPGAALLALPGGEERDQAQQRERLADHGLEAGLADAELLAHRHRLVVLELGQLGVETGAHGRCPGAARMRVLDQRRRRLER